MFFAQIELVVRLLILFINLAFSSGPTEFDRLIVQLTTAQYTVSFYVRHYGQSFQFLKCTPDCNPVADGKSITLEQMDIALQRVSDIGLYDIYGVFSYLIGGESRDYYDFLPFVRGFAQIESYRVLSLMKSERPPITIDSTGWPVEQAALLFDTILWFEP